MYVNILLYNLNLNGKGTVLVGYKGKTAYPKRVHNHHHAV